MILLYSNGCIIGDKNYKHMTMGVNVKVKPSFYTNNLKDVIYNNFKGFNMKPKPTSYRGDLNIYNGGQYVSSYVSTSFATGGMWPYSRYLIAYYQITDTAGINVFYMGTLCTTNNYDICEFHLQPGCYIYRVDGAFDPHVNDIAWTFCGAKGGAQTQLTFCIDNNFQCKGTNIMTAEDICFNDFQSDYSTNTLSVGGKLNIGSTENEVNL